MNKGRHLAICRTMTRNDRSTTCEQADAEGLPRSHKRGGSFTFS